MKELDSYPWKSGRAHLLNGKVVQHPVLAAGVPASFADVVKEDEMQRPVIAAGAPASSADVLQEKDVVKEKEMQHSVIDAGAACASSADVFNGKQVQHPTGVARSSSADVSKDEEEEKHPVIPTGVARASSADVDKEKEEKHTVIATGLLVRQQRMHIRRS